MYIKINTLTFREFTIEGQMRNLMINSDLWFRLQFCDDLYSFFESEKYQKLICPYNRTMKIRHCAREACIYMREEELEPICGKYALAKGIAVLLEEAGKDQ
ncbi:hypothetical protein T10_6612 [Trichinella papuae]|uniref:Uncharacterized protein n=1 Tax=Trichinella papuae TaxID=268474 RepID=A0A0V1MUF0_9BILA|nr:hypothetical protein T10_6612 [Trichinella papuae]